MNIIEQKLQEFDRLAKIHEKDGGLMIPYEGLEYDSVKQFLQSAMEEAQKEYKGSLIKALKIDIAMKDIENESLRDQNVQLLQLIGKKSETFLDRLFG